jgi:hypothetical protein
MFTALINLINTIVQEIRPLFWTLAVLSGLGAVVELLFPSLLPMGFSLRRLFIACILFMAIPPILQALAGMAG